MNRIKQLRAMRNEVAARYPNDFSMRNWLENIIDALITVLPPGPEWVELETPKVAIPVCGGCTVEIWTHENTAIVDIEGHLFRIRGVEGHELIIERKRGDGE